MVITVNVKDGTVVEVSEKLFGGPESLANAFPEGDVYRRFNLDVVTWRVLQRGSTIDELGKFLPTMLPIRVEQLPECVQVVHLCTE